VELPSTLDAPAATRPKVIDAPAEPSAASFLGKLAKALHGDADRRAAFELAAAAAAPHTEEDEEVFAPLAEALGVGDPEAVAARVSRALG